MAGRRLGIGEHGDIAYRTMRSGIEASFYYRNHRGELRRIRATARTKAAARLLALELLEVALATGGVGEFGKSTTFSDVAADWFAHFEELVAHGRRSPTTLALYRHLLDRHVLPAVGQLRLHELTTARLDHFIHEIHRLRGYPVAKSCKSILSAVCGLAVRRGALRVNPVRDVARLEANKKEPRALTAKECREWLAILDRDEFARRWDLPDLTRFMLGTGLRLGEAVGVTWDDIDFDQRQLHVRRTIVRVGGHGMFAKPPKTAAGERLIQLPVWLVGLLHRRRKPAGRDTPVFPDSLGGFRDRNNVERAYRRVRSGTDFEWVVPHTYRKTVATHLDRSGMSARTIADQLGHSRVSMTQDVYMGREMVDPTVADALEHLVQPDDADDDDDPPMGVVVPLR
jgi:integrase